MSGGFWILVIAVGLFVLVCAYETLHEWSREARIERILRDTEHRN